MLEIFLFFHLNFNARSHDGFHIGIRKHNMVNDLLHFLAFFFLCIGKHFVVFVFLLISACKSSARSLWVSSSKSDFLILLFFCTSQSTFACNIALRSDIRFVAFFRSTLFR